MERKRNLLIDGKHGRPILLDVYFQADQQAKPLVIFSHGFKGFKDWGHFDLIAGEFARQGFVFAKLNFSHNGVTAEDPLNFVDLEAFGNNNLSIELDDLGCVIDYLLGAQSPVPAQEMQAERLFLLGHSRGGGITILKAGEDERVKKIAAWASVNDFGRYWPKEQLEEWKKTGVQYVPNARTGQQMPLYWQLYENFLANRDRLHIPSVVKKLRIPFLILHGAGDQTVPPSMAQEMAGWNPRARLVLLDGADHTLGGKHPWKESSLPSHTRIAIRETVEFFETG